MLELHYQNIYIENLKFWYKYKDILIYIDRQAGMQALDFLMNLSQNVSLISLGLFQNDIWLVDSTLLSFAEFLDMLGLMRMNVEN